jgi:hypothetical protein
LHKAKIPIFHVVGFLIVLGVFTHLASLRTSNDPCMVPQFPHDGDFSLAAQRVYPARESASAHEVVVSIDSDSRKNSPEIFRSLHKSGLGRIRGRLNTIAVLDLRHREKIK